MTAGETFQEHLNRLFKPEPRKYKVKKIFKWINKEDLHTHDIYMRLGNGYIKRHSVNYCGQLGTTIHNINGIPLDTLKELMPIFEELNEANLEYFRNRFNEQDRN